MNWRESRAELALCYCSKLEERNIDPRHNAVDSNYWTAKLRKGWNNSANHLVVDIAVDILAAGRKPDIVADKVSERKPEALVDNRYHMAVAADNIPVMKFLHSDLELQLA